MSDDFVPSPPDFNIYVSDDEGNIDFKDRERSGGLWKKEKNGKVYWAGKCGGKRLVMFPNEARKEDAQEW